MEVRWGYKTAVGHVIQVEQRDGRPSTSMSKWSFESFYDNWTSELYQANMNTRVRTEVGILLATLPLTPRYQHLLFDTVE
jgi:hypothetical protein